jgi:hypothetical protein
LFERSIENRILRFSGISFVFFDINNKHTTETLWGSICILCGYWGISKDLGLSARVILFTKGVLRVDYAGVRRTDRPPACWSTRVGVREIEWVQVYDMYLS